MLSSARARVAASLAALVGSLACSVTPAPASAAVTASPPAPRYFVAISDVVASVPGGAASALGTIDGTLQRWRSETGWDLVRADTVTASTHPATCDETAVVDWGRAQPPEADRHDPDHYLLAVTECDETSWVRLRDTSRAGGVVTFNPAHDADLPVLHGLVGRVMDVPYTPTYLYDADGRWVGIPNDRYEPLGTPFAGHEPPALGSAGRDRLRATVPGEIATIDGPQPDLDVSRTVTLSPRGGSSGVRGLKVRDPASPTTYWFDYRDHGGLDATAPYGTDEVIGRVHWGTGVTVQTDGEAHHLPALVPGAGDDADHWEGAHGPGSTFSSEGLRVSFGEQGSTATVTVTVLGRYAARFGGGVPKVVGPVRVGSKVKVAFDRITPTPSSQSIQWLADGEKIKNATSTTYTIPASRLHQKLAVRLQAQRSTYVPIDRRTSAVRVALGRLSASRPVIKGTLKVGSTARAALGTWTPRSTYTAVRWYSDGKAIKGATRSTLQITKALRGKKLTVRVRGTRASYADRTLTSTARTVPR